MPKHMTESDSYTKGEVDALLGAVGDPWTVVKLATTFANATTSKLPVTGLAFTPAADKTYMFKAILFVDSAATTTGARVGLSWPTGLSDNAAWVVSNNSATAFASRFFGSTATANAAATGVPVANGSSFARIEGLLTAGATPVGNVQVTLASEIAASEARVKAGSVLLYREI